MVKILVITEGKTLEFKVEHGFTYVILRDLISLALHNYEFVMQFAYDDDWIPINNQADVENWLYGRSTVIIHLSFPDSPCLLRAMTYNLANFNNHKHWDRRLPQIIQVIRNSSPDIIAFQELRFDPHYYTNPENQESNGETGSSSKRSMYKDLKKGLPEFPYTHFQVSMVYDDGIEEGIGVFSRYPIPKIKKWDLGSNLEDTNNRTCMNCLVQHPLLEFRFLVTHLTFGHQYQVEQLEKIVRHYEELEPGVPSILGGDFNVREEDKFEPLVNSGWKNGWNGEGRNVTCPSWSPRYSYDRLWFRNLEAPVRTYITGYSESDENFISDHCALTGDFLIESLIVIQDSF